MGLFTSLKSDKPKYKKLKEESCVAAFSIEIPAAEAEAEAQTALMRLAQRARIPGFRGGKAPLDVVKTNYGGLARQDALDALVRRHVPGAITELKLRVVESPSVEDVQWKPGQPLTLQVSVEIAPAPTAKDYLKIPIARKPSAVDEAAVLKRLEEIREAHSRLEAAPEETVGDKHFAVIDYSASRGGKPLADARGRGELVDMTAEQSVAGLAEGLRGLKRGESKTIPVKLGGKDAELSVTVQEIKAKVLPALDGEFAKDLGFQTLDELKSKLREVLERENKAQAESDAVRQIEEALARANPFPLPPSMVERQVSDMLERLVRRLSGGKLGEKELAELRARLKPEAENTLRVSFVLSAIAEKEKIIVADAEVDAELESSLKEAADEKARQEIREAFARHKDQIVYRLRQNKTVAFLKDKALYKEAAPTQA